MLSSRTPKVLRSENTTSVSDKAEASLEDKGNTNT